MKLFLLVALLIVASGCHRAPVSKPESKPPAPSAAEMEFIRSGMKLQEYCNQGVAFDRFSEQLAATKVAFRIVRPEMEAKNFDLMVSFQLAIESWDETLAVWRRQTRGGREILRSELGLDVTLGHLGITPPKYREPTPKEIAFVNPNYPPPPLDESSTISVLKLVRIGLTEGSTRFQWAIDFVDDATEREKIKRLGKK